MKKFDPKDTIKVSPKMEYDSSEVINATKR